MILWRKDGKYTEEEIIEIKKFLIRNKNIITTVSCFWKFNIHSDSNIRMSIRNLYENIDTEPINNDLLCVCLQICLLRQKDLWEYIESVPTSTGIYFSVDDVLYKKCKRVSGGDIRVALCKVKLGGMPLICVAEGSVYRRYYLGSEGLECNLGMSLSKLKKLLLMSPKGVL